MMRRWLASPIALAGDVLYELALLVDMVGEMVGGER